MADPIDTQNVFSKTVHVQRVQQNMQNQILNEQEGFADQMRKSTDKKLKQIQKTEESEMRKTEDQQEENKQPPPESGRKHGGGAETGSEKNDRSDNVRGKVIDVEI